MCTEQILIIILTAVIAGAGIAQARFTRRLCGVSDRQAKIMEDQKYISEKQADISEKQKEISEWMLLAEMRREKEELLSVKLPGEQRKLKSLNEEIKAMEDEKENIEQKEKKLELTEGLESWKKELEQLKSEDKGVYPNDRIWELKQIFHNREILKNYKLNREDRETIKKEVEKNIAYLKENIASYDKKIKQTEESLTKDTKRDQT